MDNAVYADFVEIVIDQQLGDSSDEQNAHANGNDASPKISQMNKGKQYMKICLRVATMENYKGTVQE